MRSKLSTAAAARERLRALTLGPDFGSWVSASAQKGDEMSHVCKRFRTAYKRNGVRHVVKCRECGKKRLLAPVHAQAKPATKLPD